MIMAQRWRLPDPATLLFGAALWPLALLTVATGAVAQSASAAAEIGRAACFAPTLQNDDLAPSRPAAQGFDETALCALLNEIDKGTDNIHSVLVLRRGQLVAELYRPGLDATVYSVWRTHTAFGPMTRHDMRSISKSIVGLLYGILLAQGKVPAPATPVVSLYPEYPKLDTPQRRAIHVEHLLSMSAGLDWDEPTPIHKPNGDDQLPLFWTWSAYNCVFNRDVVAAPGSRFVYSGGDTTVLADIMVRATGAPLRDLVEAQLFQPLGITDWEWTGNIYGEPVAFAGLRLRPRDLMKIGAMMLSGGTWKSRQIVPKTWITQSISTHIDTGAGGYGYQWWTSKLTWKGKALAVATALGNGGQTLVLVRDLELAIVTTAGDYGRPNIFTALSTVAQRIAATVNE
jgi:CubicO group peptidase (beta-lactamase class C family)